jgi:hypothetical protein
MSDAKFREESKNLIDFDLYSSRLTAINRDYTKVTGQYGVALVLFVTPLSGSFYLT